jgi:dienelactone hydrolase
MTMSANPDQQQNATMRPSIICCVCLVCCWLVEGVAGVRAQSAEPASTAPGDRWHSTYLRQRVEAIEANCLEGIDSLEKWEARRVHDREALFDMMGLWPLPEKTDLKATVTGKVERDKFTVEKVHFQSRPRLYVTGDLYVPKDLDKPAPAILYLCGHGAVKKDGKSYGNKVHYQHHGAWFAEHGYVCLIIDSLQLGEIEGLHHGTYREGMWWWNALGYTPAGVEAWNCIRALDYLETRPEVDPQRIGATGRSGGGAYTWWVAALDDRIKAAAPVAGITDLRNQVIDGVVDGHCDCMFFSNDRHWDYANVAALVAPRALLIANSDSDGIFPLDGVLRIYNKTRPIYNLYDAAGELGLQISPGPHQDTQELQMAVFKFFDKHLRGEARVIDRAARPQFEPEELRVFDELPADQVNTKIQESFVRAFSPPAAPKSESEWRRLQSQWNESIRDKLLTSWPAQPANTNGPPRLVFSATAEGVRLSGYEYSVHEWLVLPLWQLEDIRRARPADAQLTVLDQPTWRTTLAGLTVHFADALKTDQPIDADDAAWAALAERLKQRDLFFVAPRNIGPTATNSAGKSQTQLRRRYMLIGESLEEMQAWDVLRAIQTIGSIGDFGQRPLHLRAQGELAAAALYASLRGARWPRAELELTALPASHRGAAPYFHILRYLDMPQAVALAAEQGPVRLADVRKDDWRFAVETAKLMNWNDRLSFSNEQSLR